AELPEAVSTILGSYEEFGSRPIERSINTMISRLTLPALQKRSLRYGIVRRITEVRCYGEKSPDNRHHRSGRLLPGRAAPEQRLRGPWYYPPDVDVQHGAD